MQNALNVLLSKDKLGNIFFLSFQNYIKATLMANRGNDYKIKLTMKTNFNNVLKKHLKCIRDHHL